MSPIMELEKSNLPQYVGVFMWISDILLESLIILIIFIHMIIDLNS